MLDTNTENRIFPFFFAANVPEHRAINYLNFSSNDGYEVFILSSLYSKHIDTLDQYLNYGLNEVKEQFTSVSLPILDRMKSAIFQAGDNLAKELINAKYEVDDVDFNVGIFAFKDDTIYVWIDGDINARIYRGEHSLLINDKFKSQFNGSASVELGDIFAISHSDNIRYEDSNFEDYVLENSEPEYAALYLDYQIDSLHDLNQKDEQEESAVPAPTYQSVEKITPMVAHETSNISLDDEVQEPVSTEEQVAPRASFNASEKLQAFKNSAVTDKVKGGVRKVGSFMMGISSSLLDFIYTVILRKNQHQLKRFQSSFQKKNLQYVTIALVLLVSTYFIFSTFTGKTDPTAPVTPTASTKKNDDQTKASIQSELAKLEQAFTGSQVAAFDQSYNSLNQLITSAKSANFQDPAYLTQTSTKADELKFKLYNITPITKVDDIFFPNDPALGTVTLIDFDVVGSDIYAIDSAGSRILKSKSSQQFEVFASDAKLTNLKSIACSNTNCFVADATAGLASINLATKAVTITNGLTSAGVGVTEMAYYSNVNSVYTLNPEGGQILRYARNGERFGAGAKWNKVAGFDINTVDFSIDGNIFELSNSGVLRKFYSGIIDAAFGGLEESNPKIGSDLQMDMTVARDADANVKNRLYIADSSNNSILVYDKNLNANKKFPFLGSYKYTGTDTVKFDKFQEVVLSSDEQFLYILENNSVYKIRVGNI
jgi:hypothetical protein